MSHEEIKILLIDDHKLVSDAVASCLSKESDFVVNTVSNLPEAVAALEQHPVDIILLDTKLPQMIGIEGVVSVLEIGKGADVIIFSGTTDESFARQAIEVGASGFIPKTLSLRLIPSAIRLVRDGGIFLPFASERKGMTQGISNEAKNGKKSLTPLELEIIRFVQAGLTNKEIARKIESSEIRVKMYMRTIFEKLGAKNRAHSISIAHSMGLINQ